MTPRDDPDRRRFLQASLAAGWASFAGTAGRLMADPPAATVTPSAAAETFGRVRKARMRSLLPVPMRDGVRLATTVFLPEAPGRHPTVLIRTPYGRLGQLNGWQDWTSGGYALVVQDVRGRHDSEGTFAPFIQEAHDTPDTVGWIRRQDWSDGRVGMAGPSYLCWSQTMGVARGDGPVPDALVPTFAPCDTWPRGFLSHGALSLFLTFWWYCFDTNSRGNNGVFKGMFDLDEVMRRLPLETLDESAGGGVSAAWREHMAHPTRDDYWKPFDLSGGFDRFTMPTLQIGGWYDYYPAEQFKTWNGLVKAAKTPAIARGHRIIVGPWGHSHGLEPTADGRVAADFGPDGTFDARRYYRSWFDRQFKGIAPADGLGDRPIRIFVMGTNKWRDEDEWPLARTRFTPWYLRSAGHANTRRGDGALGAAEPSAEPAESTPDRYDYDPDRPMPTRGGNHSVGPWDDSYKKLIWCGPCDQSPNEDRDDMLVYTSSPLEADLEVTGPVVVKLWASSSAPDTDFVARLVDVHPDDRAINITEGVIRARFRAGDWSRPQLIEPGAVLEYTIDLQATSNVFRAGHRIRLEVTSSNFPLWDRNLNTGEHPYRGTRKAVARQTVWHDAERPSRLILPVIP
jgi:hypothetical protein